MKSIQFNHSFSSLVLFTIKQIQIHSHCLTCTISHGEYSLDLVSHKHYYRIGLCFRPFVPAAFGPGTIGGFCLGSNG